MTNLTLAADVAAIARIDAVPRILDIICRTTGLGFSAVARVTDSRWVACAVKDEIGFGLQPGGELELTTTICSEIRQTGELVVIDHVAQDPDFCHHHTPAKYGFQSYISVPINLPDGRFFGTLCAIDPRPARLSDPQTIGTFKLFAELIGQHLEAQDRVRATEAALMDARETSHLREQFVAVLGHDLRNPLAAVRSSADILRMLPHDPDQAEFLDIIHRSTTRMADLINDVCDFARGRLGAGLTLARSTVANLQDTLLHVVAELRTTYPRRVLRHDIHIPRPVSVDPARFSQLLSNLIANALTHGDPSAPVEILAFVTPDNTLELSVTNAGTIPPHILPQLFKPFSRGSARPGQQGLGLGLYIASEIARAHHATLTASSAHNQTTFTFRMPLS